MGKRPRLLDLFCCEGGASMGYYRAGFDVEGVDSTPQPRYPFSFHLADALEYLRDHWREFDAVHASPPCQAYSSMRRIKRNQRTSHPDLIGPVRECLESITIPWVIENVQGAPLRQPLVLCGLSFSLPLYRHRLFESSIPLWSLVHQKHVYRTTSAHGYKPDHGYNRGGNSIFVAAVHTSGSMMDSLREAMGIDWMSRYGLSQAIPPAYTEYVGKQLILTC